MNGNLMWALHSAAPPPLPSFFRRRLRLSAHKPQPLSSSSSSNTTSANHLLSLCNQGNLQQALRLLSTAADKFTQQSYDALLLSAAHHKFLPFGRLLHRHIIDNGFSDDIFLATKLVNMYSDCDCLSDARLVFDSIKNPSIFLYNALLRALILSGKIPDAFSIFREVVADANVVIDRFTLPLILKACSLSGCIGLGKEIHSRILRTGFDADVHVSTTMMDMYAQCELVDYALKVFDEMPVRNVVSWSTAIGALVKNKRSNDAIELFCGMMKSSVDPNSVTMVSLIQALGNLAAFDQGRAAHTFVLRREFDSIISVGNSLVSMYARCGSLDYANNVFDEMPKRDTVSWNSMIAGYGIHGFCIQAMRFFEEMVIRGVKPSVVTFVAVFGACSHAGLVKEGRRLFDTMERDYGIVPVEEHYACMVDLLGRAGLLDEANELISTMPITASKTVWGALLGACRLHGRVDLAEKAHAFLSELESTNAGNYVLLADTYAKARMWDDVVRLKKAAGARDLRKVGGCSWIEVKKTIYSFVSVDEPNAQIEEINALLLKFLSEMKLRGYVPKTDVVLYDLAQEEKERIVLGHSEKLAVAFGLINTGSSDVIRITKNLRLCEDCHEVTKFISKYTGREIFVRDVNRFHRFKDGECSCLEYW